MSSSMPILAHGECILCPMCCEPIAFALVDLYPGTPLNFAKQFSAIAPQPPLQSGMRALTHCCREVFVNYDLGRVKLFTNRGWV